MSKLKFEFNCSCRSTYSFRPPFRLTATVEPDPTSGIKVLINFRLQAEYPQDKKASGVEVICAMPSEVQRVSCSHDQPPKPANSQSWDWQEKAHRLVWKFKQLSGGQTHVLKVCAILDDVANTSWGYCMTHYCNHPFEHSSESLTVVNTDTLGMNLESHIHLHELFF